jgi:hypothetical protein
MVGESLMYGLASNKRRAMNKEKDKPTKQEDKPEEGKVYALTGAKGTACIANGNTWKESEVNDDNN